MDLPDIVWGTISISNLLIILMFSLIMSLTLIKILKRKLKPEELPGGHPYCKSHKEQVEKLENFTKETKEKLDALKDKVNEKEIEIIMLRNTSESNAKTINDIRQNNITLVIKIEALLAELSKLIDNY